MNSDGEDAKASQQSQSKTKPKRIRIIRDVKSSGAKVRLPDGVTIKIRRSKNHGNHRMTIEVTGSKAVVETIERK